MLNHSMPYLTDDDLERELHRLRHALPELEQQLHKLTREREARINRRVLRLLPRLSRRVLQHLRLHHSEFLTPARLELFRSQLPAWGFMPRKNHGQALVLLQAQFKAYQLAATQDSAEQWLLRSLAVRRNDMQRDLQMAEAEQRRRATSAPARRADSENLSMNDSTDADDTVLSWAMTQTVMQSAIGAMPGQRQRANTPDENAQCIATDDSLGCFS